MRPYQVFSISELHRFCPGFDIPAGMSRKSPGVPSRYRLSDDRTKYIPNMPRPPGPECSSHHYCHPTILQPDFFRIASQRKFQGLAVGLPSLLILQQ